MCMSYMCRYMYVCMSVNVCAHVCEGWWSTCMHHSLSTGHLIKRFVRRGWICAVGEGLCLYMCMWRPEVGFRCLPLSLSTLFWGTESLTTLDLTISTRVAGQWTLGTSASLAPGQLVGTTKRNFQFCSIGPSRLSQAQMHPDPPMVLNIQNKTVSP